MYSETWKLSDPEAYHQTYQVFDHQSSFESIYAILQILCLEVVVRKRAIVGRHDAKGSVVDLSNTFFSGCQILVTLDSPKRLQHILHPAGIHPTNGVQQEQSPALSH